MESQLDLRTIQLLCSRLCHDLVGPVGAANTAVELMSEDSGGTLDAEALNVLAKSAQEASRKLSFFRAVFGLGGDQSAPSETAQLKELGDGFLASGKVKTLWDESVPDTLPGSAGKLLMLLVFIAAETLPRGGTVTVRVQSFSDGLGIACIAEGEGATLRAEIEDVLKGNAQTIDLSAREIPAHYLLLMANTIGASVEYSSSDAGQVTLAVLIGN